MPRELRLVASHLLNEALAVLAADVEPSAEALPAEQEAADDKEDDDRDCTERNQEQAPTETRAYGSRQRIRRARLQAGMLRDRLGLTFAGERPKDPTLINTLEVVLLDNSHRRHSTLQPAWDGVANLGRMVNRLARKLLRAASDGEPCRWERVRAQRGADRCGP